MQRRVVPVMVFILLAGSLAMGQSEEEVRRERAAHRVFRSAAYARAPLQRIARLAAADGMVMRQLELDLAGAAVAAPAPEPSRVELDEVAFSRLENRQFRIAVAGGRPGARPTDR